MTKETKENSSSGSLMIISPFPSKYKVYHPSRQIKLVCHIHSKNLRFDRYMGILRGYIMGVLMLTTAWDRLWGGDETLK